MTREIFRTSPLYRLTATYDEDLDVVNDAELESRLAQQLGARLTEATHKRDSNVKALFVFDALLAILLSGKDFKIPTLDLSTKDLPALMEILIGAASFSICLTALSFTTWLCYSQLLWTVTQRRAKSLDMHGGILTDAEHFNEIGIRLLQDKVALGKDELFEPMFGFRALLFIYQTLTTVLFGLLPLMHFALIYFGLAAIYEKAGFSPLHTLLYVAVVVGHLLAAVFWFCPLKEFNFLLRLKLPG